MIVLKRTDKDDYKLVKKIIENSISKTWKLAVMEWDIIDQYDSGSDDKKCACGKENIRYIFIIKNRNTSTKLQIGSSCIKKFGRKDMDSNVSSMIEWFKLKDAISDKKFISIEMFSRKLINYLFEKKYFDSEGDYIFFLKMFNKKKKSSITKKQFNKINGIIFYQIINKIKIKK